jgi:long-chain acyl-CoA synthetase
MDTPIARNSLCVGSLPARHARYRPHHTAVVVSARAPGEREVRLDWREFNAYVNRWANALEALSVVRGDRVATVLPNRLELLATYWACAKLGAAIVPLSPLLTATGLVSLLRDAAPRVVLATSDDLAVLDEARRALPPATAWVLVDAAVDDEAAG